MSYYANYETTNKSDRDVTKEFDIKQFNKNFIDNDAELKRKLAEEDYEKQLDNISTLCNNDYDDYYYKYGIVSFIIGIIFIIVGFIILKRIKPDENSSE